MGALKLVTAPSANPITLAEAKTYLRVDDTAEDGLIDAIIAAATNTVENYVSRKLMPQTWDYFLDCFPVNEKSQWWDGTREGKVSEMFSQKRHIEMPLYPLQSVTYLKTYDEASSAYTMSTSDYFVDTASEPSRLSLLNQAVWPTTTLRVVNGVQIRCVVGYASSIAVPRPLKQAILDIMTGLYECRGEGEAKISGIALSLMNPYRIVRV